MDKKLALCFVLVMSLNAVEFSDLNINENAKNESKNYTQIGSEFSISDIKDEAKDIDSVIRKTPGVYTNIDKRNGGLKVNIRNQTGLGRVNTIVDGIIQTAFTQSSDDGGGYHANEGNNELGSSSFGSFTDPNFLVDANFSEGFSKGAAGINSLVGSASFRTIDIDDVIKQGNNFGMLLKAGYESNKMGPNYMLTLASKKTFENGFYAGILAGYSMHKISQDFKVGGNKKYNEINVPDSDDDDNLVEKQVGIVDSIKSLEQNPKSILAKAELGNDYNKAKFTYKNYQNELTKRKIKQDDYIFDYYAMPKNDYLNLHFLAALSKNEQKFNRGANFFDSNWGDLGLKLKNENKTFNLDNTSEFDFKNIEISLNYGLNYFYNKYNKSYDDYKNAGWSEDEFNGRLYSGSLMPNSSSSTKAIYFDGDINIDNFNINLGTSFAKINLKGFKPECDAENKFCFPHEAANINKNYNIFNPYLALSYKFHDLFTPFVSVSLNNRAPNPNEMFFMNDGGDSVNPFLQKEKALNYQLGFNGYEEFNNFIIGYKALGYITKIDDYIYAMQFHTITGNPYIYTNYPKKVTMKGIDLSTNIDFKYVYAKLNYSYSTTNQPNSDTFGVSPAFGVDRISTMPKHKANLDLGMRVFDDKLNLEANINYFSKAKQIDLSSTEDRDFDADLFTPLKSQTLPSVTTLDLQAKYFVNKDIYITFGVFNVFDKRYINPLDSMNATSAQIGYNPTTDESVYTAQNYARGRSFFINFNARF